MWYVMLNEKIIPNPFLRYEDCMAEIRRIQSQGVACLARPVHESDL